jgi:type II secretory pathway component GspD/PulD (secretin)
LKELETAGDIASITRIHLAAIEENRAMVQIGERRPVVTGRAAFAGRAPGVVEGPVSYSLENMGTLVSATSRVTEEGAVVAEMTVERTHPALTAAKGTETEVGRQRTITNVTRGTVLIPPGKWVVLSGAQSSAEEESAQTLVLVSAKAGESPGGASAVKIFSLKNAQAPDLAKVLSVVASDKSVRIAVDARTNSLIAAGSASELAAIEALVLRLDEAK